MSGRFGIRRNAEMSIYRVRPLGIAAEFSEAEGTIDRQLGALRDADVNLTRAQAACIDRSRSLPPRKSG
jgi:hypothetical protein